MSKGKLKFVILMVTVLSMLISTSGEAAKLPPKDRTTETALDRELNLVSISNDYLQVWSIDSPADCVDDCYAGGFTIGTTGGHPATSQDDGHPLLWWEDFIYDGGSNFTTLKLVTADESTSTQILGYTLYFDGLSPTVGPIVENGVLTTTYIFEGVQVVERISLVDNPRTGRKDLAKIDYEVTNNNLNSVSAGIRIMLDVDIIKEFNNYDAPIFIPNEGKIVKETEWLGSEVPAYWQTYDPQDFKLIGFGQLLENDTIPPDRFVLAFYDDVDDAMDPDPWDYSINPSQLITDDVAVLIYFNPIEIPAGESRTVQTYYGLDQMYFTYLPLIMK